MGKPRLIILIRHAQSEGNKNRDIHQMIPDHRVKLTDEGHKQAEDAGRRLRAMLKPDDTLQIFTSPYRRTRETTEGILKTLTAHHDPDDPAAPPSPFSRNKIKVYEEPRLREQDFGNFQPCSAEMERMWAERADYGHFFYRIPNGESAADAYDRISGFNESLWRQIGTEKFPSVCVLVTHGLMTRVFLMKWFHWSVEFFEDLRNINHCEFILMRKDNDSGKYMLENQLRTWSDLKRQKLAEQQSKPVPQRTAMQQRNSLSTFLAAPTGTSPSIPARKWGGCVEGCKHNHEHYPRRVAKQEPEAVNDVKLPSAAVSQEPNSPQTDTTTADAITDALSRASGSSPSQKIGHRSVPSYLLHGRDGGGTTSGAATPNEPSDDDGTGYFPAQRGSNLVQAMRAVPERRSTPEDFERWAKESGMGAGKHADPLGDEVAPDDIVEDDSHERDSAEEMPKIEEATMEEIEAAEKQDRSVRGSVY